ncbi:NAD(P)-dependent dehydrogenase (short-subunit alcohol dehydrogenase family) [Bradyrhizobium sp. S3.12.5]|uniref:SDR family oxidoreductase n=1 Tax=Bradyrhizobium sp. S3.12.5 TaxID=3156386 RepID=UPI003394A7F5
MEQLQIVTGAAQGIGLADAFVDEGARRADGHRRTVRRETTDALASKGAQTCFVEVDVADPEAADAMVALTAEWLGPPNVLNGGMGVFPGPLETAAEDWRRCSGVDLDGVWNCGCEHPEKLQAGTKALRPVERIGRPEEIAAAAVLLASDEAHFLTGQNIVIDGGRSAAFHQ